MNQYLLVSEIVIKASEVSSGLCFRVTGLVIVV